MTTGEALALTGPEIVRAIIAEPADDALRLIYADWLEEDGQTRRAEFVRRSMTRPPAELLTPAEFWDWFGHSVAQAFPGSPIAHVTGRTVEVGYAHLGRKDSWVLVIDRGFVGAAHLRFADLTRPAAKNLLATQPVTALAVEGFAPATQGSCAAWFRHPDPPPASPLVPGVCPTPYLPLALYRRLRGMERVARAGGREDALFRGGGREFNGGPVHEFNGLAMRALSDAAIRLARGED